MIKRFFVLLITLSIFGSILYGQAELNPEAAQLYNDGNKLVKSGQYQVALEKYNAASAIQNDYRIEYQKGIVFKKLRKLDDAVQAFSKAIELKADFGIAYNALGGANYTTGKYQDAIDAFMKFKEFATKDAHKKKADVNIARAYTKLGEAAKSNGNFTTAENNFREAIKFDNYDAAYLLLAETLVDLGKYSEVLEAADKAANYRKSIPKGAPSYYKGMAFLNLGDLAKAKESFNEGKKDSKYKSLCEYQLKNSFN